MLNQKASDLTDAGREMFQKLDELLGVKYTYWIRMYTRWDVYPKPIFDIVATIQREVYIQAQIYDFCG